MDESSQPTRANLFILIAFNFLRGAHGSIYTVIWQPFVLSLGASMPTLGLLTSIGGMSGIVTTLIQALGGWLADRIGRKPVILVSSFAIIAGYAFFAIAGSLHIWTLLLVGIVILGVSWVSRPAISSITAESVHTTRQGSAFSIMQIAALVPGIIAPALGGALADRWGYPSIFPISMALELVVLVIVWRGLSETRPMNELRASAGDALGAVLRSFVPPPGLRGFFIATAMDAFSWAIGWGLLYGLLSDTYHFSGEQLGLMAATQSLAWAMVQYPIGHYYIDRQRRLKAIMIFSEACGIPLMLMLMTQTRLEMFLIAQVIFAITAATWVPVISTFVSRAVPDAERGRVFGRIAAFRGLIAFPAPAIGGWLYAWGGLRAPLAANMLGLLIILALIVLFVREPRTSLQID